MVVRSKAWVYGRSLAEIAGSNSAGGLDVCCYCYILSGTGPCAGLIILSEEYLRPSVPGCDREVSVIRRHWSKRDCRFTEGEKI